MAISHVGGITYINQNIQLNTQIQANNINHFSTHSATNIENFNDKINKSIEVREMEGIEKINDQKKHNKGQYANERENNQKNKGEINLKNSEENNNIYPNNVYDDIILDIEV